MAKMTPRKKGKVTEDMIKISVRLPGATHRRAMRQAEKEGLYLMQWVLRLVERAIDPAV